MDYNRKQLIDTMIPLRDLINENKDLFNGNVKFNQHFELFENYLENKSNNNEKTEIVKQSTDYSSKKCRKELINTILEYSQSIVLYAESVHYGVLKQKVNIKRSQLAYFNKSKLCDKALYIYNQAQSRLDELSKYGISKETQKQFQELIREYSIIQVPFVSSTIPKGVNNPSYYLKLLSEIDLLVKSHSQQYPDFYQKWMEILRVNGLPNLDKLKSAPKRTKRKGIKTVKKNSLYVRIKDESGKDILGATVIISTINPNNWVLYRIASSGMFKTSILSTGNYTVKIFKEGWKTLILQLSIKGKKKEVLDVVLQRT